ncbi:MAG: hypothetical protein AVDCRST_MAG70-301 [uncultured Thermomicrobiales bacterium]|uniref:HIT domain-containing protein n=1 Tax=uncultured Thermomicrobiales bacterium TaxID=1645740 RepID=A0A6J4UBQ8_9BACT|nr:MAG: hypothetical protein AVDCRST_MAG70-301 [uncultured Thermomicrobiales bacterium]
MAGVAVRWILVHATWDLPSHRVALMPEVIAFHHLRSSYPIHLLIVPRRVFAGPGTMAGVDVPDLAALFPVAAGLVPVPHAGRDVVAPMINGGDSQDVAEVHAHPIVGTSMAR